MTTFISSCNTKTEFRQRVRDGINVTLFDPAGGYRTTLRDMHDNVGHAFTVTNRLRSWFASVTIKADRKLKVT